MSGPEQKGGKPTYDPGENIPDRVTVPEKTLYVLTESPQFNSFPPRLIEPLAGKKERAWFGSHFYFCLPLTFGNQHGFIVKLLYDIVVRWDGGNDPSDLLVHGMGFSDHHNQLVSSHFGHGILTIQNRWLYRTPKDTNLLVMPPPNFPIHGISHMTAVVETDQLRRDFTFNLKITEKDRDIYIPEGTPIGCVLPYPRHFLDSYNIELHPEGPVLEDERKTMAHFASARTDYDTKTPGLLYVRGLDVFGNPFREHQKSLTPGRLLVEPSAEEERTEGKRRRLGATARNPAKRRKKSRPLAPGGGALEAVRAKHYAHLSQSEFAGLIQYVQTRIDEGSSADAVVALLVGGSWKSAFAQDLVAQVLRNLEST